VIAVSFSIGFGVSNSVSAEPSPPSSNGTSIPIKKGGTGATTKENALQNLLPDFTNNDNKVLGLSSGTPTWVDRTDAKSSDDVGKVKIDSTNKTMTTNGEIAVYNGVAYSINRPDLWPNAVELNFGNNLYGINFKSNNTGLGNLSGLAVDATNQVQFITILPGVQWINDECLFLAIAGVSDMNRVGTPTTENGRIANNVLHTIAGTSLYIKNQTSTVFSQSMVISIRGWVKYTK
jgi:hypothetical protein